MSEKKAFENNEVLLWGENPVKKSLLEQYDKGNKNPFSLSRKKVKEENEEEERPKPKKAPVKREFTLGEDYGVQDLDFLNKEYERIDKEIANGADLYDLQDALYELIEGLEHMQKLQGRSINQQKKKEILKEYALNEDIIGDDFVGDGILKKLKGLIGKGFKKGSPEAIAHAQKMREAIQAKKPKGEVVKKATKARVEKGSEQAKELGRRLAEAKKKKAEEAKKAKEEEEAKKPKVIEKPKGKPWYYIGDIPKGYREATEDEAIMAKKVSYYGKYVVDSEKWRLFKDYNILLTPDKTNKEIEWSMNGLKRRTIEALQNIEIYSSKLDNEKYKDRHNEFKHKLDEEKDKRKYLQAGYNWYYKLLCERTGKKYERQKIELEKPKIKVNKSTAKPLEYKEPERPIDPRTGKPVEIGDLYIDRLKDEEEKKEEEKKTIDVDLYFENDGKLITLSTKYFTPDYKLKSKYVEKLLKKGIILKKKHYTTEDYNKYFYGMKGGNIGYGLVDKKPEENKKSIVQSVVLNKDHFTKNQAIKWIKDNGFENNGIDEKENTFRFRQYNPEDLKGRRYITKKFNGGIELIISIK